MTANDDEMIRRGDAKREVAAAMWARDHNEFQRRLDALPAVQVGVKPLEWVDFPDRGAKAQAWNEANYMIQKWSDGRWELSASYPGYSTSIYGVDRFHLTLESAKVAAQADYEGRIRSALVAQPSPDVAALVEALSELLDGENWRLGRKFDPNSSSFDLSKQRAALARVKGGAA